MNADTETINGQAPASVERERVDVVIVNYNTADLLIDTLDDLDRQMPDDVDWAVTVADNDSADDSVERVRRSWPDVNLIEMGGNTGFCRANNAAIRRSANWTLCACRLMFFMRDSQGGGTIWIAQQYGTEFGIAWNDSIR